MRRFVHENGLSLFFFAIFNFLQYGTTSQVARAAGAGQRDTAHTLGVQALWLSLTVGLALAAALVVTARPLVRGLGGEGDAADYVPPHRLAWPSFAFASVGVQGYLRGVADLWTPPLFVALGNVSRGKGPAGPFPQR